MKKAAILLLGIALAGCGKDDLANYSCDDIEEQAVEMRKGALIKITGSSLVSRSASEVRCTGTGVYRSGPDLPVRYGVYRDEDGELIVSFDQDEGAADSDSMADAHEYVKEQEDEVRRQNEVINATLPDAPDPHMSVVQP